MAVSGADGQIRAEGVHGLYVGDRRALCLAVLTVDAAEPVPLRGQAVGGDAARFVAAVRGLGEQHGDPAIFLTRHRRAVPDGLVEQIAITSYAREPVSFELALHAACDLAPMPDVRAGGATPLLGGTPEPHGTAWHAPDGTVVRIVTDPAPSTQADAGSLGWSIDLDSGATFSLQLSAALTGDPVAPTVLAARGPALRAPEVSSDDRRLGAFVGQSLADLDALRLADPVDPDDAFLGAGVPWYLTLFGRDSIWAARMLLPLGGNLAGGTLRTLARRQGVRDDPATGEQPGKILHEIRREPQRLGEAMHTGAPGVVLPPVYYGTVDATALWISLLHDAWRWGMSPARVDELLPPLEAALRWLRDWALDERGFVAYRDTSGHGLANQGWKDSLDAVQFQDGTLAAPPIALCEVQAYAYAAARQGADLLDAFDRPGGAAWREWAGELAARFRHHFWVDGRYPAIALDAGGRPVDTVTSNIAHLLGTGLLAAGEEQLVVDRLAAADMDCGFGLRTMSSTAAGFNPQSYHCGSVWPHDTAIAISGLAATPGAGRLAASLIRGLLAAAPAFDYRIPELFAGDAARPGLAPVPYPTSCRPQAWSAASAVVLLTAVLGLRPDVPNGVLRLAPMHPSPVGALTVRGLRVAGESLDVQLGADGAVQMLAAPSSLRVEIS